MKRGQSVSYETLNRAFCDVQNELEELGVYSGTKLTRVNVYWCKWPQLHIPSALGFFTETQVTRLESWAGYETGHIYIPRVVPLQFWKQNRGSLRAVLRHEFGHVIAHHLPSTVRTRAFRSIFGGPHGWQERDADQPDEAFVSDYAATCPAEDFAETFAHFVTYRRSHGTRGYHPKLRAKLQYVAKMIKRLARGRKR